MKSQLPNVKIEGNMPEGFLMDICEEDLGHLFHLARQAIYSDPILATVRELALNCVDSHTEVNTSRPFEITLPNELEPSLRVRDFGKGLSLAEMHEVYKKMFSSTRRNSNDYIGTLGVGSKAPFSYTNFYSLKSYQNKKVYDYYAFIDETNRGKITPVSELPTNEPDGLEVIVPVKREDIGNFKTKAINLFSYFDKKPIIKGIPAVEWPDRASILQGEGWKIYGNRNASIALMGNVPYTININAIGDKLSDNHRQLLYVGVEIVFGIGDLEVAASRETLQHTDKTNKSIIAYLDKVLAEIPDQLEPLFENCKSRIDALKLYDRWKNHLTTDLFKSVAPEWQGEKLVDTVMRFPKIDGLKVELFSKTYKRRGSGYKLNRSEQYIIAVNGTTAFYFNDGGESNRVVSSRVLGQLVNNLGVSSIVVFTADKAAHKPFADFIKADLSSFESVQSLPIHVTSNGRSYGINPKNNKKIFLFNGNGNCKNKNLSKSWDVVTIIDPKITKYYVKLSRYKAYIHGYYHTTDYLKKLLEKFAALGYDLTIYGIKEGAKLDSSWVDFNEYAAGIIKSLVQKQSDNIAISKFIAGVESSQNHRSLVAWFAKSKLDKDHQIMQYLGEFDKLSKIKIDNGDLQDLVSIFNITCGGGQEPQLPDIKDIYGKYPMCGIVSPYGDNEEIAKILMEYVNLVDSCGEASII